MKEKIKQSIRSLNWMFQFSWDIKIIKNKKQYEEEKL
jgi:hypothetical protein